MIPIAKPMVGEEELAQIKRAIESGYLTGGPVVKEFEEKLAKYCNYEHAIAVSSGTAALHAVVKAMGIKENDEVIVPDFTFIATANAARYAGAKPVFADINADYFTIDAENVEKLVTPKTKAIIPVSLYGQAYEVDALREVARKHGLKIISDNAQSIGAKWKNNHNYGDDAMILSFYPTKNMTTGEGGAILTDSDELAEQCMLWRNIGQKRPYEYMCAGFNYRMPSINAGMGIAQLEKTPSFTEARRKNAKMLNDLLANVPQVQTPKENPDAFHVYNQYTIKAENRDKLKEFLTAKQIGANVYYPHPLHSLSTFNVMADCPNTEKTALSVLSLPVHPALKEEEIRQVAEAVKAFYG
ncbi:DegT/DnrJ/EryC1/StrS family aminotransferase [Candidatus Micrarchaeota archaeon]|nr:DegT/DnrJ/EryC1/StrS family aminotransferase [Candidatus Micrarchaeota archaeon]